MTRRPLEITTPTHAYAIIAYAITAVQGVLLATDISNAKALTDSIGTLGTRLWAIAMFTGACVAIIAAITPSRLRYRSADAIGDCLRWESIGVLTIGVTSGIYLWSLISGYGLGSSAQTQTYALGITVAGIARAVQAWRESRKLPAAARAAVTADPPPLAEVPPIDEG